MNQRTKLLLAAALAIVGCILAFRALNTSKKEPHVVPATITPGVERTISSIQLDTTPTPDTFDSILKSAAEHVSSLAGKASSAVLPSSRVPDLAAAFTDRLGATIGAIDYATNLARLEARGWKRTFTDDAEHRKDWEAQAAQTSLAPIGLSQIELIVIAQAGRNVAPDTVAMGFGKLESKPNPGVFPIDQDLQQARLDIVEVRIPIRKTTVDTKEHKPVIAGYQFAWSAKRSQWIPWAVVIYKDPNDTHTALVL